VDADVGSAKPDEEWSLIGDGPAGSPPEPPAAGRPDPADDVGGMAGHDLEPMDPAGALGVLDEVDTELGDIEAALRRLDDGSYGTCEACGRTLAEAQLEAAPAARLCPEHQP
jgi:hypothetical protein